jgi:carboxyl-terminal processing protease
MKSINPLVAEQDRLAILAEITRSIEAHFAHWQDARITPEELAREHDRVADIIRQSGDNRKHFSLQMMAFLSLLNNGHTRFLDPWLAQLPPLGMTLCEIDGQWVVTESLLPGLTPGDLIEQIEGRAVSDWFQELQPYLVGSRQSMTVQFGDWNSVFPPVLGLLLPDRYTVSFRDSADRMNELSIDRSQLAPGNVEKETEGRWCAEGVAYLKIPSFFQPTFEERALTLLEEFIESHYLIVDIRGNAGGSTPRMLLKALMNQPYRLWAYQNVGSREIVGSEQVAPADDAYAGKLYLLTDRRTWSAAEDFAMPFADTGRGVLVGETTGGSTGQPFFHGFANGMSFSIGAMRVYFPDGGDFEGVGIQPHITVPLTRADIYTGRDPVLEKVLDLIEKE